MGVCSGLTSAAICCLTGYISLFGTTAAFSLWARNNFKNQKKIILRSSVRIMILPISIFSFLKNQLYAFVQLQQTPGTYLTLWILQEEWDDSTVSSNISKMRIQNRLEATTRRERALAYAFSQQVDQKIIFQN